MKNVVKSDGGDREEGERGVEGGGAAVARDQMETEPSQLDQFQSSPLEWM